MKKISYILQPAKDRCGQIQCPYGILRYKSDRSKCMECICNDPCIGKQCPSGTKCSVDLEKTRSGTIAFKYSIYLIIYLKNRYIMCPNLKIAHLINYRPKL